MRAFSLAAVSAVVALTLIACSGSPGATLAPGATQPPGGVPTVAPPPVDVGSLCAGQPTFSAEGPLPSFAQDDALNARFPAQVDGQPVTDVQSGFWLQSMCFYGGTQEELAAFIAIFPAGVAPQISTGSGEVEIDGSSVDIEAFRLPGADPNAIFSHLPEFTAALGGDPADAINSTVTTTTLGGKSVYSVTDPDGDVSYHYVSGDTIWTVDDDESAAAAVFAAIQ